MKWPASDPSSPTRRIESRAEPGANVVLAAPSQFHGKSAGTSFFQERIGGSSIKVIEGETSDALAHADVAIAASGTVTVEAAILGTPMVTFYKVTPLSWTLGRLSGSGAVLFDGQPCGGQKNRP